MATATNSLGKITTYSYDENTNVLNWVKYPEDTDATKTVYTDDRNFYLEGLDYSNGDSVDYTYDDKGRILSATYEDGDTVAYAYDNSTGDGSLC